MAKRRMSSPYRRIIDFIRLAGGRRTMLSRSTANDVKAQTIKANFLSQYHQFLVRDNNGKVLYSLEEAKYKFNVTGREH